MRGRFRAFAAAFAAALAMMPGSPRADDMTALRPPIRQGEKAPPFTLKDLDGKSVSFHASGGRPAIVVFWSAFCPLCRELTPSLNEIARRHASAVRIVGVNLDGKRFTNAVRSYVKENNLQFPTLLDEVRNDFFLASDPYGVEKTPTAVLIDGSGFVRANYAAESMRDLVRNFDRILSDLQKGKAVKE